MAVAEYQIYLQRELEARQMNNPLYSLRAFSRDLGLSVTSLSLIFKNRQGLSHKKALNIVSKLQVSDSEKQVFLLSVSAKHARVKKNRELAADQLVKLREGKKSHPLDPTKILNINHWYSFAIIEYIRSHKTTTIKAMAKYFNLSSELITHEVDRLEQIHVIAKTAKGWKVANEYLLVDSQTPSLHIRGLHHEVLGRLKRSIDHASMNDRNLSAFFFSLDKGKWTQAIDELKEFRKAFVEKYSTNEAKNAEVFCMTTHLFSLCEERNLKP